MKTEQLPCELTQTELVAKGEQLTDTLRALDKLEDDKRAFGEKHKRAVATVETARDSLATEITEKTEYRQVEVMESPDYKRGTVSVIRLDNSTLVRERPMTEVERKGPSLFDERPEAQ